MKIKKYRAGNEVVAVVTDKKIPGEVVVLHDGDITYRDKEGYYHTIDHDQGKFLLPENLYFVKPLAIVAASIAGKIR
jgi:hypothetical protein